MEREAPESVLSNAGRLRLASTAQQHGLPNDPARAQDGDEPQRHQQRAKPGCHPARPVIGRLDDRKSDRAAAGTDAATHPSAGAAARSISTSTRRGVRPSGVG